PAGSFVRHSGKVRVRVLIAIAAGIGLLCAPLLISYLWRSTGPGGSSADSDTPFARGIRFVGVQPDLSDDILDAEGRKVGELFAYGENYSDGVWGGQKLRRDFIFELPSSDEPFVLLPHVAVSPSQGQRRLGGGSVQFEITHNGKRLLIFANRFRASYRSGGLLWRKTVPIDRVDVTLRFFVGPPGKARLTVPGPFTPETVIDHKGGFTCKLTFKQDPRRAASGTQFRLSTPHRLGSDMPVVVYDQAGRRHLARPHSYSSGRLGTQIDHYVQGLPLDQFARIAIGETPQVRTFRNILVRYPDRPQRAHAPHLDEMAKILGRPAKQIARGSVGSAEEAIKVMHLARANEVHRVASRLTSVKFSELDAATQKRLRATAEKWARLPYARPRLEGVRLGLRWYGGEFVKPALDLLDCGDGSTAGSVAHALLRCKTFSADQIAQIKRRVLTRDDPRICAYLVQTLCLRNHPGSVEAMWDLARADVDRPWLWWPALERLQNFAKEIPDRAALPKPMRLKLILATGPRKGEESLAAEAHRLLPDLLTPKLHRMNSSVAGSLYGRLIAHCDRPTATAAMVRCLRDPDGGTRELTHVKDRFVKRINLWYGTDFGRLGWDVRQQSGSVDRYDWPAIVAQATRWYDAGGGTTAPAEKGEPDPQSQACYGPVREMTVPGSGSGGRSYVDLDTGTLHAGPKSRGSTQRRRWCRDNGFEAQAHVYGSGNGVLDALAMSITPVANVFWPAPNPQVLPYALSRSTRRRRASTDTFGGPPTTFAFRTVEGRVGLLRIVAATQTPRQVRLRYRFLKRLPAWARPQPRYCAPVTPVSAGGDSGSWQISSLGPRAVVHGCVILEHGVVRSVSDGGVSKAEAGAVVLSLQATPNGRRLRLRMTRALPGGRGSSGSSSSSTSIPPATTRKTTCLAKPGELTDTGYLTLWRTDFVDADGKALKSVIYAARLVAPDDPEKWFHWPYAPPPVPAAAREARALAEKFFAAVRAGRDAEANRLSGITAAGPVEGLRKTLNLANLRLDAVYADDRAALIASNGLPARRGRPQVIRLELVRKNGQWKGRSIASGS
ncbi:MAG: hypothetical protein ACYS5V_07660, partial [Planctomycetota bacterium]